MPANNTPIFISTANRGNDGSGNFGTRLTAANTYRDLATTTNAALLFTAGVNGSRIETIVFTHFNTGLGVYAASIACVGRIYLCTSSLGANARLIAEIVLPAITPTVSVAGQQQSWIPATPLFIPAGSFIWVSMSAAQTTGGYDVTTFGGDY